MEFKYYDILSSLVMGYVTLLIIMYGLDIGYEGEYSVAYIAIAFVLGYIVNTLGSLLEPLYYWVIGGKPSDKILNDPKEGKTYSGICKVKFYETKKVKELLMQNMPNPVENDRLFSKAMRETRSVENTKISDFNTHFALSRSILSVVLVATIIVIIKEPCDWKSYLMVIPLALCWNRFRERGYYYAREVLNVYLKEKE